MVISIEWSDLAKSQLKNIYEYYLSIAGERIAKRLISNIVSRVDVLYSNPYSGRKEELLLEHSQGYRYLVVGNYKIVYWIDSNKAFIASVFDCRQNPNKIKNI